MASKKGSTAPAAAPAAVAPATPAEAPAKTTVSLKDICAELKISPTAARRKLRLKLEKTDGFRWEFEPDQVAQIKELLTKPEPEKVPAPAEVKK